MLRSVAEPAGLVLRLDLEPDLPPALTDRDQFERALLNLVVNARDAMRDRRGGTITVETRGAQRAAAHVPQVGPDADEAAPEPCVCVTVRDTGTGMPPEVRERAVEPFFTTKPRGTGTGLGLSQVYGFVRASGGQIRIDSAEGQGTSVTLHFPCGPAPAGGEPCGADDAPLSEARQA
jgi:signal transduction histidine kinase